MSAFSQHALPIHPLARKILVETEDNEQFCLEDYDDVRCELVSTGHHLTSVLMNPRETLLDDLFDEFAYDQTTPLDFFSSYSALNYSPSSTTSMFSSSHSSLAPSSSHHYASASSHNAGIVTPLALTTTELQQIDQFVKNIQRISKTYQSSQKSNSRVSVRAGMSPHSLSSQQKANDDLRVCYEQVPDLFFRSDFSLTRPEHFQSTMCLVSTSSNSPSSTTSMRCSFSQERLSSCLDLVEVALLRQIWSRSIAFFRTLDDLKGLRDVVQGTTARVQNIRAHLLATDKRLTAEARTIPTKSRRRDNLMSVHSLAVRVQEVLQGRTFLLQLLEAGDYFTAQEALVRVQDIYLKNCRGVRGLDAVGGDLQAMAAVIADIISGKFITLALQWDIGHNSLVTNDDFDSKDHSVKGEITDDYLGDLNGLTSSLAMTSFPLGNLAGEELSALIVALVGHGCGLDGTIDSGCGELVKALQAYQTRLSEGLKLTVRTCVMEYLQTADLSTLTDFLAEEPMRSDNSAMGEESPTIGLESSVPYIQRVREMSADSFLGCLLMAYEHLLLALERASDFHAFFSLKINQFSDSTVSPVVLEERFDSDFKFGSNSQLSGSKSEDVKSEFKISLDTAKFLADQSKFCLSAACDVAQKSVAQLLSIRKENNARLPYATMKQLWENSLAFVAKLESFNHQTTAFALRQCLLIQCRIFIEAYHDNYKTQLVNTLDNERWLQCDVSPDRQKEIDRLVSGKAFLTFIQGSGSGIQHVARSESHSSQLSGQVGTDIAASISPGAEKKKEARPVVVEKKEYRITWSVLLLVDILFVYLDIVYHFPPILAEVINKMVELVRLFNTRTKQLVLGAQAIQSAARLKSITAKHLGITAQSLSFCIVLLPHMRAALLAQIPSKQQILLTELDRLSQELFDHHHAIINKFVAIVSDMIEVSAIKLKSMDWDRVSGHGQACCEYFEEMQKNILTLHKVLNGILPAEEMQDIFLRIFHLINRKVPVHFEEVMPSSVAGKQRILDDITHLVFSLSKLKHVDTSVLTAQLEDHFRKKFGR
eukprot:gene9435-10424_t